MGRATALTAPPNQPEATGRQVDGEGPQLSDVQWGGQWEREVAVVSVRLWAPPVLAKEGFVQASGPPRKSLIEVLI